MHINATTGVATDDGSYIYNGQGYGVGAGRRFDIGMKRPYIDRKGRPCVIVNENGTQKKRLIQDLQARGVREPVLNDAAIGMETWVEFDRMVERVRRQRLSAWTDLAARSSRRVDGMRRLTIEYRTMTDVGEAIVDMDATSEGRADKPVQGIHSMPLPITHSNFYFSKREIGAYGNDPMSLDMEMAEMATRRIMEMVEKTTIGTETGMTYGGRTTGPFPHTGASTVWGYTNFPYRVTKTDLTIPTGSNPEAVNQDILEMIETMRGNGYFGPYTLYHSTGYSTWLDSDYFRTGGTAAVSTLRQRIMMNPDITAIKRLDYLTSGYQLILIDNNAGVAQAVTGMDVTVVQTTSKNDMQLNFMVMCIMVPFLRTPYNGIGGILHATTS